MTEPTTVAEPTTQTPAPAPATTAPAEATATLKEGQTQTATTTAPEVKPSETQKDSGLPKSVRTDRYKLRAERRESRERIEKLERMVADLSKTKPANTDTKPEEPPTFFDDPAKATANVVKQATQNAITEMQRMEAEKARVVKLEQEGQRTIEALLNKPEIGGSMEKIEEIDEIILNDPRLAEIVKISPELAGKEAFEIWARDKGIDAKSKAAGAASVAASSGPASSAMTPKSALTKAEIAAQAAQLDISDPKYKEKWQYLLNESLKLG